MSTVQECYLVEVGFGFESNDGRGFSRGRYIPYRTLPVFVQERCGYSVFRSAYRYNSTEVGKCDLYGDLYLDFDDIHDFEKVRKDALTALSYLKICYHIAEEYVAIYFSGNKGVHLIVPANILGIEPMPLLNGVFKSIATSIKSFTPHKTVDTQIYDNKRMFRIPNTVHEKSKLYKIPITVEELRTLSHEQIKQMATQKRWLDVKEFHGINVYAQQQFQQAVKEYYIFDKESKKDRRFKAKWNFTPPCIQAILENGAEEGQRNITIACLSGFCKNCGKSLIETTEFISEWNSRNIKPTGEQELKRTVRSIFMGEKQFGCSTLKTITTCDESRCPLKGKKGSNQNVAQRSSVQESPSRSQTAHMGV